MRMDPARRRRVERSKITGEDPRHRCLVKAGQRQTVETRGVPNRILLADGGDPPLDLVDRRVRIGIRGQRAERIDAHSGRWDGRRPQPKL